MSALRFVPTPLEHPLEVPAERPGGMDGALEAAFVPSSSRDSPARPSPRARRAGGDHRTAARPVHRSPLHHPQGSERRRAGAPARGAMGKAGGAGVLARGRRPRLRRGELGLVDRCRRRGRHRVAAAAAARGTAHADVPAAAGRGRGRGARGPRRGPAHDRVPRRHPRVARAALSSRRDRRLQLCGRHGGAAGPAGRALLRQHPRRGQAGGRAPPRPRPAAGQRAGRRPRPLGRGHGRYRPHVRA